jgi:hypothetical protein
MDCLCFHHSFQHYKYIILIITYQQNTLQDIAKTAVFLESNLKENIKVNYTPWGHLDFIVAFDAHRLVYDRILNTMNARRYG